MAKLDHAHRITLENDHHPAPDLRCRDRHKFALLALLVIDRKIRQPAKLGVFTRSVKAKAAQWPRPLPLRRQPREEAAPAHATHCPPRCALLADSGAFRLPD